MNVFKVCSVSADVQGEGQLQPVGVSAPRVRETSAVLTLVCGENQQGHKVMNYLEILLHDFVNKCR